VVKSNSIGVGSVGRSWVVVVTGAGCWGLELGGGGTEAGGGGGRSWRWPEIVVVGYTYIFIKLFSPQLIKMTL